MQISAVRKFPYAILGVLIGITPAYAGNFSTSAVGTSTGKFLSFGTSARAAAMGEAYCAAAQDADAVRYNPAALVGIPATSVEIMHANYLADTSLDQGAFARRLGSNQVIGISALQMSYGSIAKTDETGYQTGTAHPANLALTAAYAQAFDNRDILLAGGALGISISYIQSTIVSSAKTFAASLGLLSPAYGPYKMKLALVAENLIGTLKFDQKTAPLPMTFKLGGIMHFQQDWIMTLDLAGPRDNAPYAAIGAEKWFQTQSEIRLAIRGGYNMRSSKDLGGLAGFATGIGISFNTLALDYALTPFGDLGYTHKLTLGFKFGDDRGNAEPRKTTRPISRESKPALESEPSHFLFPETETQTAEPATRGEDAPAAASDAPAAKKSYQDYLEAADDYISQKDYKNAAREYNKAQKALPENDKRKIFTFEQQGQISLKMNNISKAKEFYLAAIRTAQKMHIPDTRVVNAYLGLAYCFEQTGNTPPAIKNYEKALKLSTDAATRIRISKRLRKLNTRPH